LDVHSGRQVLEILKRLSGEHGKTIVMVTHDPEAAAFADREFRLESGRLAETSHP